MATVKEVSQKQIVATLTNKSLKEIFCERYFDWSGKVSPFPPSIPAGGVAKFKDFGDYGAVIYDGHNVDNSPVSWVLAWDARLGGPDKVYVTCGTKSAIDNLTEKEIKEKLEQSSDKSSAKDGTSKTTVDAEILEENSVIPTADIFANFGLLK
ncbi:hypothetical protein vseg_008704 [Gypsophila vaccaria]